MSIFGNKYYIEREIALLHEELRTIEQTKEVVKSEWWGKMRDLLIGKIINCDTSIVKLSANIEKNKEEIRNKHSLRTAYRGLITGVETTLDAENAVRDKLKQLEETSRLAELNKRQPA